MKKYHLAMAAIPASIRLEKTSTSCFYRMPKQYGWSNRGTLNAIVISSVPVRIVNWLVFRANSLLADNRSK